jgi:hypothetical protein
MKRKINAFSALSLSVLLGCTLLAGCSSNSEDSQTADEMLSDAIASTDTDSDEPTAYFYLDYAEKDDDGLKLAINLYVQNGTIVEDLDADQLEFGGDLADAIGVKINEVDTEENKAVIWLTLPDTSLETTNLDLDMVITIKSGAVKVAEGQDAKDITLEQEISTDDASRRTS